MNVDFSRIVFEDAWMALVEIDVPAAAQIPTELRSRYENTWDFVQPDGSLSDEPGDHILRSIVFRPEFHEAGMSILSYFGTILRDKYPDTQPAVTITQQGHTVSMIIETQEGRREEIAETLQRYVAVARGKLEPRDFLSDSLQILRLENKLDVALTELRAAERLINVQTVTVSAFRDLLSQIGQPVALPPIHVRPTINVTALSASSAHQAIALTQNLPALTTDLEDLQRILPDATPRLLQAAKDVAALEGETDPDEVKPRLSRIRKIVEDLGDEKHLLNKTIKGVRKALETAQSLGRGYNAIAQWCGAPTVPEPFLGK